MYPAVRKPRIPFLERTVLWILLSALALSACIAPASAAIHTLNPGDSIQTNITKAAADDILILNPGTYTQKSITISKNITICANTSYGGTAANTIVDAKMGGRIFTVNTGYSLAIDNLTLKNTYLSTSTGYYGGAINLTTKNTLSVTSSIFSDCSAYHGGAISAASGNVTIASSTFKNCSATSGYGGAIYTTNPTTITSSTFTNCSAKSGYGGAIYAKSNLTITSATITQCSASNGGAIYAGINSNLNITSSTITSCSAATGGAISADTNSNLSIASSTITNCSATSGNGGAIDTQSSSNLTIVSSTITNCSATSGYGGAIYSSGNLTITDSAITNCSAKSSGAIDVESYGNLTMTTTTITNCSATSGNGGAILATGNTIITTSTIKNCSAKSGGAISASGNLTMTTTTTTNCSASSTGGAIYASKSVTITSSTLTNCSATDGGAIYISTITPSLAITSSTIFNCSATSGNGGAIYDTTSPLAITSSTIFNCSATSGKGGAIYGGYSSTGSSTITSTTITNCSASYGGAIQLMGGNSTITSSTISDCSASYGGAIDASFYYGSINISSSTITHCSASSTGSAIYATNGATATLHFSRLFNNTGTVVYRDVGTVNATHNWWGSNANASKNVNTGVTYSPWLVLGVTATPSTVTVGTPSTIRANLTYDSAGAYHDPASGYVPDGIPVAFTLVQGAGTINPQAGNLTFGVNTTTFTPSSAATAMVNATIDSQSVGALLAGTGAAPVVMNINPATMLNTSPLQVNVTGTGFSTTTVPTVNLTRTGFANVTLMGVNVISSTSLNGTVPAGIAAGMWNVSVTNPSGQAGTNASVTFTVTAPFPAPTLISIAPVSGINSTATSVTITGTGFNTTTGPMFNLTRAGYANITLTDPMAPGSTEPDSVIRVIPSGVIAGVWNLTAINPDGQEGNNASVTFTVTSPEPAPVLTGIIPAAGLNTTTTSVTIYGNRFNTTAAPKVNLSRSGYSNVMLDGTLGTGSSFTATVPADMIAGPWNVTVINPGDQEGTNASVTFTATNVLPAPTIHNIEPETGDNIAPVDVALTGTNFDIYSDPVVNLTRSGYGNVTLTDICVADSTSLTARVPAGIATGLWNVTLVNPDGKEGTNVSVAFIATSSASGPTLTAIAPFSGSNTTATLLAVTGTNFDTTPSTVGPALNLSRVGYANVTLHSTNVTSISFTATVPPGTIAGVWNVTVFNPDGDQGTNASVTFTVTSPVPAPRLISVSPVTGTNTSVTEIVITGTGFNTTTAPAVNLSRSGYSNITLPGSIRSGISFTATVPEHLIAGVWNLTVVNPDGQEGTNASVTFTSVAPIPAPTLLSVSPAIGLNTTVTEIVVTGTGFNITTAPAVNLTRAGYSNITLPGSISSSTAFAAVVPEHVIAGIWNVTAINPDGQEATNLSVTFTVIALIPAPTITGISPVTGRNSTTTEVTVTGTGFNTTTVPVVRLNRAGFTNVTLNSVSTTSATSLTGTVPAGIVSGVWNVFVVNPDQQEGSLLNGFTVTVPIPAPVVTGITPPTGVNSTTTAVTITGTGFNTTTGSEVRLNRAGFSNVTLSDVSKTSSTSITGTVPAGIVSGVWNVFVVNPDQQEGSLTNGFTVTAPIPAPVVTGITPSTGMNSTTTAVTITGTGFNTTTGSEVRLNRAGFSNVTLSDVSKTSSTSITGTVPAGIVSGMWNVFVVNPDQQEGSLLNGFTVTVPIPAPVVTGITPPTGVNSTTTAVTITGTGFNTTTGSEVRLNRVGFGNVTLTGVSKTSSTSITGTVPAGIVSGVWNVFVVNPDQQEGSLLNGFTVTVPIPAPVVTGITPPTGVNSTTTAVTITGTGFNTTTGSEVRLNRVGFANVTLTGVSKTSSTSITGTVPAGIVSGMWNVFVVNPDQQEGSLLNGFTVTVPIPAPVVTGITPPTGVNSTTTAVTITGTGFNTTTGSEVRLNRVGFANVTLTGVSKTSSTSITGTVPAGIVSGMWNVFVVNPDQQEGSLTNGFTVTAPIPAPVVTGITPSTGMNSTTTAVTITGTGFNTTTGSEVRLNRVGFANVTLTGVSKTSSTSITGTVPAGIVSGMWNVFVVNPDQQEGSLTNGFTVTAPIPAPVVTGISPVTGLNTTATMVTITGRDFNVTTSGVNLTRTGYASVPLTGVLRLSSTSLTGTIPAGVITGAWTVAVTNPDGQTGTNASVIFTPASPGPVPAADFTFTPVTGVVPLTVAFTDRSTNSPTSWSWDFGDGSRSTNQNPSHTYTTIGVYDVTLSATNAIGTGSKTMIRNISVTTPVNQSPANYEGVTLVNPTNNDFLFNITDIRNSGGSVTNLTTSLVDYQPVGWHRIVVTGTNVSNDTAYIYADKVSHVTMTTLPYKEIIVGVGTAESQFTLEQLTLVKGAAFGRDVVPGANNTILSQFQGTVPGQNLALGYTVEVTGDAPFNANRTGLRSVFINLSASHSWVLANGGTGAIRIFHLPDNGIPEVLATTYIGGDGTTDYFTAYAGSLSIFGLGGVTTVPVPTPVPTLIGGGYGDEGPSKSSLQQAMKAPLQLPVTSVSVNVGQIGHTSVISVDITGVEVKDIIVTAAEAGGPDTDIPLPPGIVYEYTDISPAHFTEIAESKIHFYVPLPWLDQHSLAPGDIILYHNTGKTWEALPTTLDTIRDGKAYYTAAGSGFSRFAITGQPGIGTKNAPSSVKGQTFGDLVPASGTPPPTYAAPLITQTPVVTRTTAVPAAQPAPVFQFAILLVAGAAVVVLIGGVFLIRRWWIRRQNPALFREYD